MAVKSEKFLSGTQQVQVDVFLPAAAGKYPAVLVLHGSFGLLPEYRADIVSFPEALVAKGIAAVMPHYLESTNTSPGMGVLALIPASLPSWRKACADALTFMAKDPRFDVAHFGVLGFSLGGHLALSLAMDPPAGTALRCVVDFFGPTRQAPLEPHWAKMPPALIFHGTKDPLVPMADSEYLVEQLKGVGKKKDQDYFFEPVPGEGHGFKGAALVKSRDRSVEFLKKAL